MREILNPYSKQKDYNCFGCSPDNNWGLRMRFFEDGEDVICSWDPRHNFQGYYNVLHGGIQATLMDEIASWVVQVKLCTAGVTARMETKYHKPVLMDKGDITLKARVKESRRRLAVIDVELFNSEGVLCSSSVVSYITYPEEIARKKLNYPDFKEFFNEK
jgi:uncharacterized protein (TIGR00369 family)